MKIVINKCYGGFILSTKGRKTYAGLQGKRLFFYEPLRRMYRHGKDYLRKIPESEVNRFCPYEICYTTKDLGNVLHKYPDEKDIFSYDKNTCRYDPLFVQVIEKLGDAASDRPFSCLEVVEIPDDIECEIEEEDGMEWIVDKKTGREYY